MKAMNTTEARQWCSQDATSLGIMRDDTLQYKASREHRFFITAPEGHRDIVILSRDILYVREEVGFNGGLIWLQRWDIGSPQLVRPGWRILEDIRRAHGEPRSLDIAPAQLFREDELVELHAFLIQVIAYGWVADFVPSSNGFFFHFKSNGQICLIAKSAEILNELRTAFREWNPADEDPIVAKMASMKKARLIR